MVQKLKIIAHPTLYNSAVYWRALALGVLMIVLLLTQLFTYEHFYTVIMQQGVPGGAVMAITLMIAIPVLELLSIPFLLTMDVNNGMWQKSKYALCGVGILWVIVASSSVISNGLNPSLVSSPLFGATIAVPNGIWFLFFTLLLMFTIILIVRESDQRLLENS